MKPAHVWSAFAACAVAVLAALAWSSASMLRLERAERAARAQAALEENTRLALWRLDSALMPLLARENGRSPAEFAQGPGASPAAAPQAPEVLLHFQVAPSGEVTSPENRPARLEAMRTLLAGTALAERLPREPPVVAAIPKAQAATESFKNVKEFVARQQTFEKASALVLPRAPAPPRPRATREGPLGALWIGDALLLARRVGLGGDVHVQGCWLDWPRLRGDLLASIQDLLPHARLEPAAPAARPDEERRLATLPVRLLPGHAAVPSPPAFSATRLSLLGLWTCALLAALAVAALLRGVMDLSERRRVFVSAVTHELRTPLTTFRLYTDMLAEGMVAPESRRREYLERLRGEAERLGHLVENVLFYARVETGRSAAARETMELQAALSEMRPRLVERAARAGLEMAWPDVTVPSLTVRADRAALEQILLNLVDNACKYAAGCVPARIEVSLDAADGRAVLRVRDHGPGVPPTGRRRLFRPFSKSDRDAANSAPGIGLGLALSRRLARAQGGDLGLEAGTAPGAVFVLSLPLAAPR